MRKRTWNSLPLTNTSKTDPHAKHFLIKTNWKLAGKKKKKPCTTKAERKIHTESGKKEREAMRTGPVPLGKNVE